MITGADVVAYRERRNISRRQLAADTGLTEGKIWRIENKGNITPDETRLLTLVGVTATTVIEDPVLPIAPIVVEPPPAAPPPGIQRDAPDIDLSVLAAQAEAFAPAKRLISNSELQTFKRCRRKWWLAWYRGLHERNESPVGARQVGNRLHRALQTHYVPGGPPTPQHLLDELERLIVLDRAVLQRDLLNEDTLRQFESEADLERIMLEGYIQWLAETGADAELKVVAPEAYVEAELDEFGKGEVAIIGKLDVRVRRTTDNAILFIDHKAVAEFTTTTRLLVITEQMIHYLLLEYLNAGGEYVSGALYNMLRRVKRTGNARPPFYQRVEVRHNQHVLNNFRTRLVGEITAMLSVEDALNRGTDHQEVAYPTPTRDCSWDCPFLKVCPMFDDGSRVEDALTAHYVQQDPLAYYMTEVLKEDE